MKRPLRHDDFIEYTQVVPVYWTYFFTRSPILIKTGLVAFLTGQVVLTPLAYVHVGNDCLLDLPALTYHNHHVFKLLTLV